MRGLALREVIVLLFAANALPQTTQGIIAGRVHDQVTLRPLVGASLEFQQLETNTNGTSLSSPDGSYYLPLLPPGTYRIRVGMKGYQAREVQEVVLPLAGYVAIDFALRPIGDVWERERYRSLFLRDDTVLPFYGPDMDPSYVGTFEPEHQMHGQFEPSLSLVIDPKAIATLPLAGRDVYAALVLQPGVSADSTTSRGLGLSANGQRPSSSSFLLDGVQSSDRLLSGPALEPAPEMVQEYRVSTSNFSAEYGGTAGYIANAITRSAGEEWHGIAYGDLNNSALNANTFQHNANSVRRTTSHQIEGGVSAGGRIPGTGLRSWTAVDNFGSRSFFDPQTFSLPSQELASLSGAQGARLLDGYPPAQWAASSVANFGPVTLLRPVTLRRFTGLERLDYSPGQKDRVMARFAGDSIRQPDFFWTPYGQSAFRQSSLGLAVADTHLWSSNFVSEVRASVSSNRRSWDPALANLPFLTGLSEAVLPSSSNVSGWHEKTETNEVSATLIYLHSIQALKFGAGVLDARPRVNFTIPPAGQFEFACLACKNAHSFIQDDPTRFTAAFSRLGLEQNEAIAPNTVHSYRYDQPYFFVQEDLRLSSMFALNLGMRYEHLGSPVNTGANADTMIQLGAGGTLDQRVDAAQLVSQRGPLYNVHGNTLAVRLAFSLSLSPQRGTLLRAGAGTFYDRPPDNFWTTAAANDIEFATFPDGYSSGAGAPCQLASFYKSGDYGRPPPGCAVLGRDDFLSPTLFQSGLRNGRVQSAFLSLQQPLGRNAVVELNGTASHGLHLLATDVLNRSYFPVNQLLQITYRTDEGASNYSSLSSVLRYRTKRASANVSWTWSHSIDNQSDPLLGEFFDLGFGNQTERIDPSYHSGFTVEGNSRVDRADSDFDQRHTVVGWASFALPAPSQTHLQPVLRNWNAAGVFAVRSGLPYNVYAGDISCHPVCNRRADVIDGTPVEDRTPVAGGVQLLNPLAFAIPTGSDYGTVGRNAFSGPGFWNLDVSLSRTFSPWSREEEAKLILRADAFNVFNHANLQNPEAYLGVSGIGFGVSQFGSIDQRPGFPTLTPVLANARQIHILLRLEF